MSALSFALPPALEAAEPPPVRDEVRLMVARPGRRLVHAPFRDLPQHLHPGDLLVVNASATLPAALPATRQDGTRVDLHLSTPEPPPRAAEDAPVGPAEEALLGAADNAPLRAADDAPAGAAEEASLGAADNAPLRAAGDAPVGAAGDAPAPGDGPRWVVELRRGGERVRDGRAGEALLLPGGARVRLLAPYLSPGRLWVAELELPAGLHDYLAAHGAPIRYAHETHARPLEDHQTIFAEEPGSAEMPSAGRPFTASVLGALRARGIGIAKIVLHTGVSSLERGERPYPERFRVSCGTAAEVNRAHARGSRVIAVGTTVVRALESAADARGTVHPRAGWTGLTVTPETGVKVVDGLLTGWHEPAASHLLMLEAIAGRALLERSYAAALARGYRWHEFGDVHLIVN